MNHFILIFFVFETFMSAYESVAVSFSSSHPNNYISPLLWDDSTALSASAPYLIYLQQGTCRPGALTNPPLSTEKNEA